MRMYICMCGTYAYILHIHQLKRHSLKEISYTYLHMCTYIYTHIHGYQMPPVWGDDLTFFPKNIIHISKNMTDMDICKCTYLYTYKHTRCPTFYVWRFWQKGSQCGIQRRYAWPTACFRESRSSC